MAAGKSGRGRRMATGIPASPEFGNGRKIVVGLSGGVDSSVALLLLKKQGWKPVGVSLKFPSWGNECNSLRQNACCTPEAFAAARRVCEKAGAPYFLHDASREFSREVIDYFTSELAQGRTPNPCSFCNWKVKFALLRKWAARHRIKYVATGHYAKISEGKGGRAALVRPKDSAKDQTYGLCLLPHAWLKGIIFPLAELTKAEVYEEAIRSGFSFFAKVPQSQDLCFVSGNAMHKFLEEKLGVRRGPIIDAQSGREIGRHDGIFNFTIGQRRGLRFPSMHFVEAFDAKRNAVLVTRERQRLARKGMIVSGFNWVSGSPQARAFRAAVQIHPHQKELAALITPKGKSRIEVRLGTPLEGLAPGQICAAYRKGICLGGGAIEKARTD